MWLLKLAAPKFALVGGSEKFKMITFLCNPQLIQEHFS
jgi:hypothetical protein